jgi:hypothetical protein
LVTLADGSRVAIEDVNVGDFVRGQGGSNKVIAYDRPQLIIPDVRNGTLYGINGSEKFITSEHPVMTGAGWKAIDQENAKKFEPHLSDVLVGNLEVGDELVMEDGTYTLISSIEKYTDQPQQQLYNLMLDGDHTYYVNGILVHNKGDGGGLGAGSGGGRYGAEGGYLINGQFDQRYADGGVTGGGNIDLHVPINIGGGGQGGGFGGGNGIQQGGTPQSPMGGLGSLLGQPQQAQQAQQPSFMSQANQVFGGGMNSTRGGLGQSNQATQMPAGYNAAQNNMLVPLGGQNGLYGGTPMSKPSYEQYLAGRSPYQQDVPLSRAQYENNVPQQGAFNSKMGMADGGVALSSGGRPFFSPRTGKYQEHAPQLYADGGLGSLGGYSDGGRLLRGPGDGVSDSIPATIGQHQPARLADGEFVVPARIVSELGNGSTEAGARQLYAMMDRIQAGRKKTVGKNKVAANTRAAKHLPA